MYNLDVNFLKDRSLDDSSSQSTLPTKKLNIEIGEMVPLIAGAVVMVLLPVLAFSWSSYLKYLTAQTQKEIGNIEQEIQGLEAKRATVKELEGKLSTLKQESRALVSVFDRIKPWSAILQDISDRTPVTVQIDSIVQDTSGLLQIDGMAASYEAVTDFVLTLKESEFFQGTNISLKSARLTSNPSQLDYTQSEEGITVEVELPQVVEYQIEAELSETPASELLQELEQKGAVGLVNRIKNLKEKGLLQ
ncbi:MAG: PilN domain-containing protein [Prochloron sp. SP5CPC1]|nr:PilN domain-containing protein [Candidatus Paraprochloron terpiosi SP5CPC1]